MKIRAIRKRTLKAMSQALPTIWFARAFFPMRITDPDEIGFNLSLAKEECDKLAEGDCNTAVRTGSLVWGRAHKIESPDLVAFSADRLTKELMELAWIRAKNFAAELKRKNQNETQTK